MNRLHKLTATLVLSLLPFGGPAVAEEFASGWSAQNRQVSAGFDAFWQTPRNAYRLDHGWLLARNDAERLYLLLDMTGDTVQDRPTQQPPWGDYLSLSFDVDGDRRITPDRDLAFGLYPGSHRIGRQYFKGPGSFTGLQATAARLATRFGSSPALEQDHRLWEISIPLEELQAKPGGRLRLGLLVHSQRPAFNDPLPPDQARNFDQLLELQLAAPLQLIRAVRLDAPTLRRQLAGMRIQVRPDLNRLHPVGGGGSGLPPGCQPPSGEPVKRSIEADGSITLLYANGSRKQVFNGGWKSFCPDGTPIPVTVLYSTQISPTMPPTLPDPQLQQWLEFHNMGLLGIIRGLVEDDTMVERYLATENAGWSPYEVTDNRLKTINYLLAE